MIAPRLVTAALLLALSGAACSATPGPSPSATRRPSPSATAGPSPSPPRRMRSAPSPSSPLGRSPRRPRRPCRWSSTRPWRQGAFDGVTASVISADRGSWSGVAGSWDGVPVSPDSRYPTHSAAKTVVAAEVFRLVEDGSLALDDLASSHLPPDLSFFDANGATIRQVLGMRSGIPDLNEDAGYYPAEQAATAVEVFRKLPESQVPPGTEPHYASTNYVLLGTIIEHAHRSAPGRGAALGCPRPPRPRGACLHGRRRAGRRWVGGRDDVSVPGSVGLGPLRWVRALRRLASRDDRLRGRVVRAGGHGLLG